MSLNALSSVFRSAPLAVLATALVVGCSGKSSEDSAAESTDGGGVGGDGTNGGDGTDGGDGGSGTTLDNGPGGSLVMANSCAPDDGPALSLVIGLGSGCDMGAPDPTTPFVQITVYDGTFLSAPVGTTLAFEDWTAGAGRYAPEGSSGPILDIPTGTLHLDDWEGAEGARPEGGAVSGWYELDPEGSATIGNTFTGVFCGGEPLCG